MFRLTAPSVDEVSHFILEQQHTCLSYPDVGASVGKIPNRYSVDRNRIQLGTGEVTWHLALRAIRDWQMFNLSWVRLCWPTAPIQVGTDVAVLVSHFGFYSLNACRIIYVVDEDGPVKRYGFAYGTLTEHAARGEERFTVEWNREKNEIRYDILTFSSPNKLDAKLGYPVSRFLQYRFAAASKAAMLKAVSGS
jgi:uncharacterized protein (UPF0548 family)